ncbi:hypothetical protein [Leptospira stimsonii]|uniref:Uncharacterized protein n=1 Tax=Leptospira stimsonii TaxID=2202203 RepID=A0ABY2N9D1_9LEPT|nr:hypothetical protein [Leptospira stimsonii]TGK18860.1 hypothetical protein EHO98_12170 [Leptospira stimsonii]TGM18973.1 hypothetical protein EHQ90_05460 [Leptospira stimsonii]
MADNSLIPLETPLLLGRGSNNASHALIVRLSREGYEIHIVDCAIRFQAYSIAEATKSFNTPILHEIQIQRAFTPYQLLDFINSILSSAQKDELKSKLFLFLAPSKQFFDGDVKVDERIALLDRLIEKFKLMQSEGFQVLISESIKKADPIYQSYLSKLNTALGTVAKEILPPQEVPDGKNSPTLFE